MEEKESYLKLCAETTVRKKNARCIKVDARVRQALMKEILESKVRLSAQKLQLVVLYVRFEP